MDLVVEPREPGNIWELTDLLGRPMGAIAQEDRGFIIAPAGHGVTMMSLVHRGPYPSLDAALAEIETRTRGVCRRRP